MVLVLSSIVRAICILGVANFGFCLIGCSLSMKIARLWGFSEFRV